MSTPLTPDAIRALEVFVDTEIMRAQKETQTTHLAVAAQKTQATATGLYAWLNNIPIIQRKLGQGGYVKAGLASSNITVRSELHGLQLQISARDVRDNQTGLYSDLPGQLGMRMAQFPQIEIWARWKEGDQTTYNGLSNVAFDGLSFFNDSHYTNGTDSSGGTYDNNLASTALSEANLQAACAALARIPDEQGQVMNQKATHLIVPPQLALTAAQIVYASTVSTGGVNMSANDNRNRWGQLALEVVEVPELAGDATTWYVVSRQNGKAPFIWQETQPLYTIALTDPTRDRNMIEDDCLVWIAKGESGFAFGDPRCAIRAIA